MIARTWHISYTRRGGSGACSHHGTLRDAIAKGAAVGIDHFGRDTAFSVIVDTGTAGHLVGAAARVTDGAWRIGAGPKHPAPSLASFARPPFEAVGGSL